MKTGRFSAGIFGVVAIVGCAGGERRETRESVDFASSPGCDQQMWVGVRTNPQAPCPAGPSNSSGSWLVEDPFASRVVSPQRAVELCVYSWEAGSSAVPSPQQLNALQQLAQPGGPLLRMDESCVKTSAMGIVDENLVGPANAAFAEAVDRLAPLPQGPVPPARVHVALVDSLPDSDALMETNVPMYVHGRALGLLINDLACPDPATCPITLSTHLAFGRSTRGAFAGRPAEVAIAIHDATDSWRAAGSPGRLLINLSVGWDNVEPADLDTAQYKADTFAVYSALAEASCYGALIFAAAGNTTDGPSPDTGPLFPAAWEQRRAPTNAECASELGITNAASWRSEDGPLVHSVGGVDGADEPLSSVRLGARPRFAAPAEHSAQSDVLANGTVFRSVLSGSSVAAAVGTAVGAIAWSYRPELTSAELAELLYEGSEPLPPAQPDYCVDLSSCSEIRRLSICGAVQAACANGAPRCPASLVCRRRPAFFDARLRLDGASIKLFEQLPEHTPPSGTWETYFMPECDAEVTDHTSSVDLPCPNRQYANATSEPYGHPQPGASPCRVCAIARVSDVNYKLYVSVDPYFVNGMSATNASVQLIYPGGLIRYYNAPLPALSAGQEASLYLQPVPGFSRGTISFLVSGGGQQYSTRDPLVVHE